MTNYGNGELKVSGEIASFLYKPQNCNEISRVEKYTRLHHVPRNPFKLIKAESLQLS